MRIKVVKYFKISQASSKLPFFKWTNPQLVVVPIVSISAFVLGVLVVAPSLQGRVELSIVGSCMYCIILFCSTQYSNSRGRLKSSCWVVQLHQPMKCVIQQLQIILEGAITHIISYDDKYYIKQEIKRNYFQEIFYRAIY